MSRPPTSGLAPQGPAGHRRALGRRRSSCPRHRRVVRRGGEPADQEGADAARQDRDQPLLRALDAHPRRASRSPRSGSRPTTSTSRRRARRVEKGETLLDTDAQPRGDGARPHRHPPRATRRARHAGARARRRRRSTPATARTSTRPRRCSTPSRSAAARGRSPGLTRRDHRRHRAQPGGALEHPPADASWAPRCAIAGPRTCCRRRCETLGVEVVLPRRGGARRRRRRHDAAHPARAAAQRASSSSLGEYFRALRPHRASACALAKADAIVLHPGPMNRGVEIASDVADGEHSVILEQVDARRRGAHGGALPARWSAGGARVTAARC